MVHSYCPSLHVLFPPMITFSHRGIAGKPVSGQDERQLVSGDAGHRATRVDAREGCEIGIQNPVVAGVAVHHVAAWAPSSSMIAVGDVSSSMVTVEVASSNLVSARAASSSRS